MAGNNDKSSILIRDITSCSICLETFKAPKVLPCIHTFCLQCLETYCAHNNPGETTTCPLCRKVFSIPPDGIRDLPNNFFMHQLLQVNTPTNTDGRQQSHIDKLCELCSDSELNSSAALYCIECDQHICDRCSMIHKKTKALNYHQVVRNEDIQSSKEQIKLAGSYCDQHPEEQNRLYCYDCNMVMCLRCVSKHSQHKLADVSESAEKFSEQMKTDIDKVSACALRNQQKLLLLETDTESFKKKVASTQSKISQKYGQLISLIKSQESQLIKELHLFKDKMLKYVETEKDERERQFVIIESFKIYCQETMNKGSACDISRTAHDLHARAEELVKTQDEPRCQKLSGVKIMLEPTALTTERVINLIGKLVLKEGGAGKNNERKDRLNADVNSDSARSFLDKPTLLSVITGGSGPIHGITVLDSKLFVVRGMSTRVSVYNTNNFTLTRNISITGSSDLRAIVASPRNNCLYISDVELDVVHRYHLSNKVITKWSVGGECFGLSLTNTNNVLVTLIDTKQIKEYTPVGRLIREISLDSTIEGPWHSVQLSRDKFVVSHGDWRGSLHLVCQVDTSGRIIQCYGGAKGSGVGQLNGPRHLAVDGHGNVLVADYNNKRVVLLSPSLTHLGYKMITGRQLNEPYALHHDELTHRLYIGELTDTGRVFVLTV